MPLTVLIVDDSTFFRQRVEDLIKGDERLKVIGTAADGKEAIERTKELKPDVITMDVEMPKLNGIEAVKAIMRESPTNILMLSSLTREGARVTIDAMEAGAIDYLSKDMRAWYDKSESLQRQLREKIVQVALARSQPSSFARTEPLAKDKISSGLGKSGLTPRSLSSSSLSVPRKCDLIVIGSSTGGPAALQLVLKELPEDYPYPILLVQHMPKSFTSVFAERLNQQCRISVKEAADGDPIAPGTALLAPGGSQMMISPKDRNRVNILSGDDRLNYKPCIDLTFSSVAKTHGDRVLGIVMTGMGTDGCEGAKLLKGAHSTVWAQDEASSVVDGMPKAIREMGLADGVFSLNALPNFLIENVSSFV